MALNNLGLGFIFTARDLASAKMARLERRFSSLDDRVSVGTARMSSAFRQLGVGLGQLQVAGQVEGAPAQVGQVEGDGFHALLLPQARDGGEGTAVPRRRQAGLTVDTARQYDIFIAM